MPWNLPTTSSCTQQCGRFFLTDYPLFFIFNSSQSKFLSLRFTLTDSPFFLYIQLIPKQVLITSRVKGGWSSPGTRNGGKEFKGCDPTAWEPEEIDLLPSFENNWSVDYDTSKFKRVSTPPCSPLIPIPKDVWLWRGNASYHGRGEQENIDPSSPSTNECRRCEMGHEKCKRNSKTDFLDWAADV